MYKFAATAFVIAAAISGCAGNPFDDITRSRPADESAEHPDAAKVAALVRVAEATAIAGDLGSAASMYRRAHETDPRNVDVMNRLGDVMHRLGDYEEAVRIYRRAAAFGPNGDAYRGLARALIALDQPKAAISQLEAALRISETASTYSAMGVAYDLLGDHGAAQAYYRTGLDLDPGNPGLQNNLGLSLAVSGHHAESIEVLRRAVSGSRATARTRLNLALAYGLAGQTEEAAKSARIDLDESAVQRNLSFYATLRALGDSRQTIRAIGAHNAALTARTAPKSLGATAAGH